MSADLATTNLLLGIMAAVSVLEGLLILGIGFAAYRVYAQMRALLDGLEQRQIAPAVARVNSILDDVKGVTNKVKEETDRVDQAIHTTIDRIDDTAGRVRSNVRAKTSRLVGAIRGVRVALETFLEDRDVRTTGPQHAEGRS